jgi:predicted TPR repeat methyltransferase
MCHNRAIKGANFKAMNRKQRRAVKERSAASTRGDDPIDLHSAGIEAFRVGRLDLAADMIARAIAADGHKPDFHYNLAIVLKSQGKLEAAAASYQRAIALKPDYADAHNNLGNIWKNLGQRDKAMACFYHALQARPGNADTLYNLGILCGETGDREAAAHHFHQCLEHDPEDSRGVRILLAHLGLAAAPQQTSPAQLQKIYDVRSRFWDGERSYLAPGLVAAALQQHVLPDGPAILDIGCGTGLVGALVRPMIHSGAGRLDGIDISAAMLEKAKAKGLYDRLDQADLVPFLSTHTERYDAILGAATLIHFGDLKPVLQAAALALRGNGLFIFTLFAHQDDADFAVAASNRLAQSGCYSHSAGYVERLAAESGFSVRSLEKVVHEHDQDGNPVPGLLAVLQRA